MSTELQPQITSDALWTQIRGKVDRSFLTSLKKLDEMQHNEDISPYLAETVRDMIFQLVSEDPKRAFALAMKCLGLSPMYLINELQDGAGDYRFRKSAELVANGSHGAITASEIILEYSHWKSQDN